MNLSNLKITNHLAIGFGTLVALMMISIVVSIVHISSIQHTNTKFISGDWVNANAAINIDSAARDDARRTLALFILPDKVARAKSY